MTNDHTQRTRGTERTTPDNETDENRKKISKLMQKSYEMTAYGRGLVHQTDQNTHHEKENTEKYLIRLHHHGFCRQS